MEIISDKDMSDFLSDSPLYSKIKFCELKEYNEALTIEEYFSGRGFKFYCPYDKEHNTFKFDKIYGPQHVIQKNEVTNFYLDKYGKITFTIQLKPACQMCGYKMDIVLNIFSDQQYSDDSFINLNLRKIGQLPAVERLPENEVLNYLTEEDKDNYKKALANLSISYGIGAYAYLRRIIENEIKNLVRDISELDLEDSKKVKEAYLFYEENRQMAALIDTITPFLPPSLKENGDNMIKLLYKETSGGLHEFSEAECLKKAKAVDQILRYVIKKVSSLKFEYKAIKKAMKDLSK